MVISLLLAHGGAPASMALQPANAGAELQMFRSSPGIRDFHNTLEANLTKRSGGAAAADTVEIRDENMLPNITQTVSGKLHLPEINNSGSNQVNAGATGNSVSANRSLSNSQSEQQAMEQSAMTGPVSNR